MSDVRIATLTHPYGTATVAVTAHGVVRVAFDTEDPDAVARELSAIGVVRHDPDALADTCAWLTAALEGTAASPAPPADLRLVTTAFARDVVTAIDAVPAGSTITYRELAAAAGHPSAIRAAAHACATNPVPLIIGCHRVVRSDGTPGKYRGGVRLKELLLQREALVTA
jgi:methylated-DNA-[protein]-cysteine S-methyltransferase